MEKIGKTELITEEMFEVLFKSLDDGASGTVERSEFYDFMKLLISKNS